MATDYYLDTNNDGKYDTVVAADNKGIYTRKQNEDRAAGEYHQFIDSTNPDLLDAQIKRVAESLASNYGTQAGSSSAGAGWGVEVTSGITSASNGDAADYTEGDTYGAPSLKKEDFFNADGTQKDPNEVAASLKAAGAKGDIQAILAKVLDFMPQLEKASEKEKGFLGTERGFAERGAELSKEADIYGLQKEAGKVGAATRGAYGGMGTSMRAGVAGQAALGKGIETTYDKYGLSMDKAAHAEEKGLYGLEEGVYGDFESEIESTFFKSGGRVPSKGSFSQFLSSLPEAGGN